MKRYLSLQLTAALMAGLFFGLHADASHRDFYVAEHTDFGGCGGSDLNAITPQFVDYLRDHGWTSVWLTEGSAWPQDLKEDSLGGIDHRWGDARKLSAYAGHGYTDPRLGLAYGTPHNGKCRLDIDAEMRLGERVSWGGNGKASFFFAMTSCTVHLPKVPQVWFPAAVGLAQVFGFHDSPAINDNEPRLFLQSVRGSSSRNNRTEWLNRMDNCGPWYWFCSVRDQAVQPNKNGLEKEVRYYEKIMLSHSGCNLVNPFSWPFRPGRFARIYFYITGSRYWHFD